MAESQQIVSWSSSIIIMNNQVDNLNLYLDGGTGLRRPTNISSQVPPPCTKCYERDDEQTGLQLLDSLGTSMQPLVRIMSTLLGVAVRLGISGSQGTVLQNFSSETRESLSTHI